MVSTTQPSAPQCPFSGRNDSKSAQIAQERAKMEEGAERISSYEEARKILLSKELVQGGAGAASVDISDLDATPVFYLDGPDHLARRASIAHFFTPKAVSERYHVIIERETERLIGRLKQSGEAKLDELSFELTVAVVADIVGLTNSSIPKMARRLAYLLSAAWFHELGFFARGLEMLRKALMAFNFYISDVLPALRARRKEPQDDLLSQLLAKGASRKAILTECMTYAAAGMVTTREFIVMAAWHLLERPELREDYLEGDEKRQFTILNEILRLETIAAFLYRRSNPKSEGENKLYALDLRAIHEDEETVGPCPLALDPDREKHKKIGSALGFGAGPHHCPGKQVALHESRMFLDALLRLPGIRLKRAPDIGWSNLLMSYELRNAVVTCDPT